jgi:mannose-6-phosphate isomerase-like protein (cupin superfamily)
MTRDFDMQKTALIWFASCVASVVVGATLMAQHAATSATFLTGGEIDAVRKQATGDIQMVVANAGKYNVGLATMRRNSTGKAESPIVHAQVTEVYYITDGGATILTGGTVTGANALVKVLAGPTTMGGTVANGESRKVGKGDFVIIPAGVQHSFSSIDGSIEYLMIRIDGDQVLPAGLVHDIVKSTRQPGRWP